MKVLVIEDSADVAESMRLCLQLRWPDAVIETAAEGAKGLEMLQSDEYDIAILDINLPDMSGFDVLTELRTSSNVPVIIVTVRGAEDDQAGLTLVRDRRAAELWAAGRRLELTDLLGDAIAPEHPALQRLHHVFGLDRVCVLRAGHEV